MTERHPRYEALIDAQLDGELDSADARDLETHLSGCATCARFREERRALHSAIVAGVPTFTAPAALRARITSMKRTRRVDVGRAWIPLALAASFALVAVGSWNLGQRRAAANLLADEVLSSHVRSLMPGHLIDVASSDQHTVKPWFNGKLDFSPPVHDFAAQGYPLLGGRLDYVGGRTIAVLTYQRRQHVINVFVWPANRAPNATPAARDRQGYHELHWSTPEYDYWVVSDLAPAELREFMGLLQRADVQAARGARALAGHLERRGHLGRFTRQSEVA